MAAAAPVAVEDGSDVIETPSSIESTVEDGADVTAAPNANDWWSVNKGNVNKSFSFGVEDMDMLSNDDGDDGPSKSKTPRKLSDLTAATSFTDDSVVTTNGEPTMSDLNEEDYPNKDKEPALEPLYDGDDESDTARVAGSCCWRGFKCGLLFLVFFAFTAFGVVMIGARLERNNFQIKSSTHQYYQTPQVCAVDDPATDSGVTFGSVLEANNAGAKVAHCGDCGACSTAVDMDIMAHTAETLTRDTTYCAFKSFMGRKAVEKCMEGK
jgi:hypothetical protein